MEKKYAPRSNGDDHRFRVVWASRKEFTGSGKDALLEGDSPVAAPSVKTITLKGLMSSPAGILSSLAQSR